MADLSQIFKLWMLKDIKTQFLCSNTKQTARKQVNCSHWRKSSKSLQKVPKRLNASISRQMVVTQPRSAAEFPTRRL